ncbi:metallophosphoesterase, partial [Bacillus haynesii]|nr:metallophosphoesterase [Bacillus haynesii]
EGETLNIIGIDDYSTKRSDIAGSYKGLKEGYNLVLTHDPNVVLDMKEFHFDYLLSGHFHGGQIHWPKPYHLVKMGKLVRMNMIKGLHYHHDKPFYISEGLGQTGANIRIGSRPEMTFHHIS